MPAAGAFPTRSHRVGHSVSSATDGMYDLDAVAFLEDAVGMRTARHQLFVDLHGYTLAAQLQLVEQFRQRQALAEADRLLAGLLEGELRRLGAQPLPGAESMLVGYETPLGSGTNVVGYLPAVFGVPPLASLVVGAALLVGALILSSSASSRSLHVEHVGEQSRDIPVFDKQK